MHFVVSKPKTMLLKSGTPTNPGELRTPITFERPVITKDEGGFKTATSYTTIATAKCKWKNAHGSEVYEAESIQAKQPATIWARYRSDVDATCTVLKGSTRFEIIGSPDNVGERGEYMEIKVKVLVNG